MLLPCVLDHAKGMKRFYDNIISKKRAEKKEELIVWMEHIEDKRREWKIKYSIKEILVIVLFATLANAQT